MKCVGSPRNREFHDRTGVCWALADLLYLFTSNIGIPRPRHFLIDSFLACRISNIFTTAPVFVLFKVQRWCPERTRPCGKIVSRGRLTVLWIGSTVFRHSYNEIEIIEHETRTITIQNRSFGVCCCWYMLVYHPRPIYRIVISTKLDLNQKMDKP